jgi:hypothetical protein
VWYRYLTLASNCLPDGIPDNVVCPALHPELPDARINERESSLPIRKLLQRLKEQQLTQGQKNNSFIKFRRDVADECLKDGKIATRSLRTSVDRFLHYLRYAHNVKGEFLGFLCTLFNTASLAAHQIPLREMMLDVNPELLRIWHRHSDDLTTRLDLIDNI